MASIHDHPNKDEMIRAVESLRSGGGPPYDGGMEARIAKLEGQFEGLGTRLDGIDARLDRIEDKIPSKWDMAQVIFYVVGGLMAAAIFGPRLIALFPASP